MHALLRRLSLAFALSLVACGPASGDDAGPRDAGTEADAGPLADGGPSDDAGPLADAGPSEDAGPSDAGDLDAGDLDAGPPTFSVRASVSGLPPGFDVTLGFAGADVVVSADGETLLDDSLADGSPYDVGVTSHPLLRCDADVPMGTVAGADVVVTVSCAPLAFFAGAADGVDYELWASDGTAAGTHRIADLRAAGPSRPGMFELFAGKLYFRAEGEDASGAEVGRELFVYDGINPPSLVADLLPGPNASTPRDPTVLDGQLYFIADNGADIGLYRIDSSGALSDDLFGSTHPLGSIRELEAYDGALFFPALFELEVGVELYRFEAGSLSLAADLDSDPSDSSSPRDLVATSSGLYFSALVDGDGRSYRYTRAAGAEGLPELNAGSSDRASGWFELGGELFVIARDGASFGEELFVFDGAAFANRVDFNPGPGSGEVFGATPFNGGVVLKAFDGTASELYFFDGASATPMTQLDSFPLALDPWRFELYSVIGGRVLFLANDGANGLELWTSDGTLGAESMIDICAGACSGTYTSD